MTTKLIQLKIFALAKNKMFLQLKISINSMPTARSWAVEIDNLCITSNGGAQA